MHEITAFKKSPAASLYKPFNQGLPFNPSTPIGVIRIRIGASKAA